MPDLQTFHGHVVDLRRHVNVHWRHLHPIAPTDRYELWLRAPDGTEHTFTVHTREMPARRGHEVSLITTAHRRRRVLALANWTTIDGVNHARSELPGGGCWEGAVPSRGGGDAGRHGRGAPGGVTEAGESGGPGDRPGSVARGEGAGAAAWGLARPLANRCKQGDK
jgi:hypothetical protein